MPGRAAYYKTLAGFELSAWPGMEALGFGPPTTYRVPVPAYLKPFSFMPLFNEFQHRGVLVYRLRDGATRPTTQPLASR